MVRIACVVAPGINGGCHADASTKIVATGETGVSTVRANLLAGQGRCVRKIILKSLLVALGSTVASLAIVSLVVPALGGSVDGYAWLMSTICPLLISGPASVFSFRQSDRLRRAHDALAAAHA